VIEAQWIADRLQVRALLATQPDCIATRGLSVARISVTVRLYLCAYGSVWAYM